VARRALRDWLGVALIGVSEPASLRVRAHAERVGSSGHATLLGSSRLVAPELAAWANGTAGHAADYDDTFSVASGFNFHPTAPVLPAALALGEEIGASGDRVLVAYVVGFEVAARLGTAVGRSCAEAGWHPTAALGTLAAAAACANLLELDATGAANALGIASSFAAGLYANTGAMTKPLHAGNAARAGVVAALLAKEGLTAASDALEGERRFLYVFSGGTVANLGESIADLGKQWHIVSPGIAFKAYPCCRATHAALEAAVRLRRRTGVTAERVRGFRCRTNPRNQQLASFDRPNTGYEAKFSIPYCVAAGLVEGDVGLRHFEDAGPRNPAIDGLVRRFEGYEQPERYTSIATRLAHEVVLRLDDGAELAEEVLVPKGDPANPMSEDELLKKFLDCARRAPRALPVELILERVVTFDHLPRASTLLELLR
jgi:2-methylcitrate dehydratase PrpD